MLFCKSFHGMIKKSLQGHFLNPNYYFYGLSSLQDSKTINRNKIFAGVMLRVVSIFITFQKII